MSAMWLFGTVSYIVVSISLHKCIRKSSHVTCSVRRRRDKVYQRTMLHVFCKRERESGCQGDCLSPLNRVLNCAALSRQCRGHKRDKKPVDVGGIPGRLHSLRIHFTRWGYTQSKYAAVLCQTNAAHRMRMTPFSANREQEHVRIDIIAYTVCIRKTWNDSLMSNCII